MVKTSKNNGKMVEDFGYEECNCGIVRNLANEGIVDWNLETLRKI